ncbi:hypothetical protein KP509_36G028800 [Ceratopteris richardii]|uniref:Pentatricopeptide repeat-containing protein n=1 Tax=Ceratopteris richardii TaxID=49495 RepID=A0A8T2QBK3_CERRI|nr:hypothetical protein KP509_36G028800 [Ceratopteris richardii]
MLEDVRVATKDGMPIRGCSTGVAYKWVSSCNDWPAIVHFQELCKKKLLAEAISYASAILKQGVTLPCTAILLLLRECTRLKDLPISREAHSFVEAQQVLSGIPFPSSSIISAIFPAFSSLDQCVIIVHHLNKLQKVGTESDKKTVLSNSLKTCSSSQSLAPGRLLHQEIIRTGLDVHTNFGNMIINMYIKCNCIEDARRVFDRLALPDIVSWGTMIMGHAMHGYSIHALLLFEDMQKKGLVPNKVVLLGLLKACLRSGDFAKAFQVHDQAIRCSMETDTILGSMLIDVYSKFGNIAESGVLFERLRDGSANEITWSALIAGYVQHGNGISALQLFDQMKQVGISPDKFIYSCVFRACDLVKSIEEGKRVHAQLIYCNAKLDVAVGNSLIDMYAKCGALKIANKVFDSMFNQNLVSWGALIAGHVQYGNSEIALELHGRMKRMGLKPDMHTSSCLLKACGEVRALQEGRSMHDYILRNGYIGNSIIGNALVDMYARCGSLEDAEKVFTDLRSPDLVSWDSMIAGLVQHGKSNHALERFPKMCEEGVDPDEINFLSMLKACASCQDIEQGRLLNNHILLKGFDLDMIVGNGLIDMYVKCKSLEEARLIFDKLPNRAVVSWGLMLSAYAEQQNIWSAIGLLKVMQSEVVNGGATNFLCILKACSKMKALKPGRHMHFYVLIYGYDLDLAISNTLVYMYAESGSLQEAQKVFDMLPVRNVVAWDMLISGYVRHGDSLSALQLWSKMCEEDVRPIKVTFLCTLKVCSSVGAMQLGRLLHHYIVKDGLDTDLEIGNTIIDLYGHCGSVEDANWVFDNMQTPDLVTWAVSITASAYCGSYISIRKTLKDLQNQGLKPNEEIFLSFLNACRQAGLVKEGHWCFGLMMKERDLAPNIQHCSCMVDLLSRAGCFEEARGFIHAMPCEPDAVMWTSLLASSNFFGNVQLSGFCLSRLVELSYHDAFFFELMSNDAGLQDDFSIFDKLQPACGMQKAPETVLNEHEGIIQNHMVQGSNRSKEITISNAECFRQEDSISYVNLAIEPKLPGVKPIISSVKSCTEQFRVFQLGPVNVESPIHYKETCIF